jgi:hypothetical protein
MVPTQEQGAWEPDWKALFTALQGCGPSHWTVLVLAARGMSAPWLFQHLVQVGWHPFLRITLGGKVRPLGRDRFEWLKTLVPTVGSTWGGRVDCFVEKTGRGTVLAHWEEGSADPWLILTALPAQAANVVWYGMRSWIESGFKDPKRGGWQWHQTKMTDPARASRLWLASAVAMLWGVSVGSEGDARQPCSGLEALPPLHVARRKATQRWRPRLQRCFAQGLRRILGAQLHGEALPVGQFLPEPWPVSFPARKKPKPPSLDQPLCPTATSPAQEAAGKTSP